MYSLSLEILNCKLSTALEKVMYKKPIEINIDA